MSVQAYAAGVIEELRVLAEHNECVCVDSSAFLVVSFAVQLMGALSAHVEDGTGGSLVKLGLLPAAIGTCFWASHVFTETDAGVTGVLGRLYKAYPPTGISRDQPLDAQFNQDSPLFGLKRDLVRILANLTFRRYAAQEQVCAYLLKALQLI